jgi:hypothetical protein
MQNKLNTMIRKITYLLLAVVLSVLSAHNKAMSNEERSPFTHGAVKSCFTIKVVDSQTGRGVPLVELRTTNNIRYFTDSQGIVAFYEPGLMDQDVFFLIDSPGYEYPKDGFGYRGKRLKTTPGSEVVIQSER